MTFFCFANLCDNLDTLSTARYQKIPSAVMVPPRSGECARLKSFKAPWPWLNHHGALRWSQLTMRWFTGGIIEWFYGWQSWVVQLWIILQLKLKLFSHIFSIFIHNPYGEPCRFLCRSQTHAVTLLCEVLKKGKLRRTAHEWAMQPDQLWDASLNSPSSLRSDILFWIISQHISAYLSIISAILSLQERSEWVLGLSHTILLIIDSLLPMAELSCDPLPGIPKTFRRLLAGYLIHRRSLGS